MNNKKAAILPIILLICGIFILCLGISETSALKEKNFTETVGYYTNLTLAEEAHYDSSDGAWVDDTYYLTYRFEVGGTTYFATTDYSTSLVPSVGEEIKILYDAENPENAVISSPASGGSGLILFGIFFILGSLPFLFVIFGNNTNSPRFDKAGVLMGSIVAVVGYGALAMICGSFSPIGIFKYISSSFVFPIIIPFLMIFAGVFAFIKSIFFYKPQD